MSDRYTYREFRDSDLDSALRLWEQESGWGAITSQQWREWFLDTPYGPAPITVAVNHEGQLIGQTVGIPSLVAIDGRQLKSLRVSAPVILQKLRGGSLRREDHPTVGLFRTHMQLAREMGFSIAYAQPRRGFLPFFRWVHRIGVPPFAEAQYECLEWLGSDATSTLLPPSDDYSVSMSSMTFGQDFDALWESAAAAHAISCATVRTSKYLNYKLGSYIVLEVREKEHAALHGYVAIRPSDGLVVDILTRNPACSTAVIAAAIRFLANRKDFAANDGRLCIKAMSTRAIQSPLQRSGFRPARYKFAFVCCSLDNYIARDCIAPERWYLTPGD
jgi:hypothetical protein